LIDLLAASTQGQTSNGFDWGVLAVPVVAGMGAIAVAIYNTRGETASLRRLKAMNDVIEKLPKDSAVTTRFSEARDDLAQRVAARTSTNPRSTSRWLWALPLAGAVIFGAAVWTAYQYFPPGFSAFELFGIVALSAVTGAFAFHAVAQLITIWLKLRAIERETEKWTADLRRQR